MRITNGMLVKNMMGNLNNNLRRMDKIQQQFASGKKFQLPSDDPIGVSKSLKLHTDLSKIEQYKRNLNDAKSWLEITEDSLAHIGEVLNRTKELTIQAGSGTNSQEDLNAISQEIEQLRDEVIKIANTTYAGRSIFTGYKTDSKLLDKNSGEYLIDLSQNDITKYNVGVSDDIEVNIVGIKIFGIDNGGTADYSSDAVSGSKSHLIKTLTDLRDDLKNGTFSSSGTSLEDIEKATEQVLSVRAEIGAKVNRLELTQKRLDSETINFTKLLSDNEDADMAKVIMDMKIEENVYRASLSAGAKIIQPSLIDFLR